MISGSVIFIEINLFQIFTSNCSQIFEVCPCVKSIQRRSIFYSVSLRIQYEYGKIRTRKNFVFGHLSRSTFTQRLLTVKLFNFLKFWNMLKISLFSSYLCWGHIVSSDIANIYVYVYVSLF